MAISLRFGAMCFNLLEFDDLSAISCSKVRNNITAEANCLHRMKCFNVQRFGGRQGRENTLLMVATGRDG